MFRPRKGSKSGPRASTNNRTYCSLACFRASQAKVTKTCPVCGKDFTVRAAYARRYRVCSAACKTADTKYVDCDRCGNRFRAEKHLNRRYCSEECRRPPMILTCRNCKRRFREIPSAADRQFCSLACYRSFVGETGLEARIRAALEILGVEFRQEFAVGRWSIDFALLRHKVAIEADGDYWHRLSAERDARRDACLTRAGWRVVRLPESDVNAAGDLPRFVLGRVQAITGLSRSDLVPSC
jgi:very-short-patch-repair endonuclease